jgi:LysM repeat protein
MALFAWFMRGLLPALLLLALTGCLPSGQGQADEEKEPHFLAGKSCINSMDFRGAIEEFEKALTVNSSSAAAHYQLGWLYEQKEPDPAAAIFHYERYLKLRPNAENAEWIRQRINNCKQDLARTVLPLPITPSLQRQFEQYAEELKQLREDNERLRQENEQVKLMLARQQETLPGTQPTRVAEAPDRTARTEPAQLSAGGTRVTPQPLRTHTVQSGENPYSIARRYGVRLDALMSANPGVDARRLRVGQTLNIPTQ